MSEASMEGANVWVLVDHSVREVAFREVGEYLSEKGARVEIVTITEVIGTAARGALAGGAERLLRGLRVAVQGKSDEDFLGAMRRARPDVLAVTDARYARSLGLVESLTGIDVLQVGVMSDFQFGADWTRSPFKAFIVPHEEFKSALVRSGLEPERVIVAGPAVQGRFSKPLDRDAIRDELKLKDHQVVLVRAEGLDSATLEKLVFQATLVEKNVRFVFHHQGDSSAAGTLRRAAAQYGLRALMFGKVNDLERYFAAADLVVAPPREVFMAEIVAQDRPLLLIGDEAQAPEQVEFLTRHGAARHVHDLLKLGAVLDDLLGSGMEAAQAAADSLSGTSGAKDVAEALMVALKNRNEWKTAAAPKGPIDEAPEDSDSPFEVIGSGAGTSEQKESDYSGISMAQARDQLANLIMQEREVERRLDEVQKQQERWRGRLNLAREWNEVDLADEAQGILRGHMAEADQIGKELQAIQRQKEKLKFAAHGGSSAPTPSAETDPKQGEVENRFRKMEAESDLKGLKDRIRREFGE